jgi:hypothetical protein
MGFLGFGPPSADRELMEDDVKVRLHIVGYDVEGEVIFPTRPETIIHHEKDTQLYHAYESRDGKKGRLIGTVNRQTGKITYPSAKK